MLGSGLRVQASLSIGERVGSGAMPDQEELAHNVFLRCPDAESLAALRWRKDTFGLEAGLTTLYLRARAVIEGALGYLRVQLAPFA